MIVLIDDERDFISSVDSNSILIFRNSHDAVEWLLSVDKETNIDQLWLDHDLGIVDGEKDTIMPFIRKLEELVFFDKAPKISQILIHTSNNIGGDQMMSALRNNFRTTRVSAGDYLVFNESLRKD